MEDINEKFNERFKKKEILEKKSLIKQIKIHLKETE
jgi:hypothetical protein